MRKVVMIVCLLLLGTAGLAETSVQFDWPTLKAQGKLQAGEIVDRDGVQMLKITNPNSEELKVTIVALDNQDVSSDAYAILSSVAYENVEGEAYLEMLNYFPQDGPYFSRTLGKGPLGPMTGSSDARPFVLPFYLSADHERPTKLEISAVMPGRGTICIGPIRLVQY